MRKSVSVIKKLLDECTDEDRGEWKSHTQTILSAVRTSHPTRRGVTGAIASGFFENSAFPALAAFGWTLRRGLPEDPFTFAMEKDGRVVRVLIASLQPGAVGVKKVLAELGTKRPRKVLVLVGPEGDFTPAEVNLARNHGCQPITLGPIILRTETAAIYCVSVLAHELFGE